MNASRLGIRRVTDPDIAAYHSVMPWWTQGALLTHRHALTTQIALLYHRWTKCAGWADISALKSFKASKDLLGSHSPQACLRSRNPGDTVGMSKPFLISTIAASAIALGALAASAQVAPAGAPGAAGGVGAGVGAGTSGSSSATGATGGGGTGTVNAGGQMSGPSVSAPTVTNPSSPSDPSPSGPHSPDPTGSQPPIPSPSSTP